MTGDNGFAEALRERAARLSRPPEEELAETRRVIMFDVAGERYGLAIENVREIFRPRGITPVPGAGTHVAGVANLRGEIVTVLDLAGILEVRNGEEQHADLQIIIAEEEDGSAGLLVDRITGIVDIAINAVEPPLNTLEKVRAEHLLGEFKIDDRLVGLLNPTNILRLQENG